MWGDSSEHKRCKGIRKNVVKKHITHDDYRNCLLNREEQMRTMNVISSHLHDVYAEEVNKVALSAEDDKKGYYGRRNTYLSRWSLQPKKLKGRARAGGGGISWLDIRSS